MFFEVSFQGKTFSGNEFLIVYNLLIAQTRSELIKCFTVRGLLPDKYKLTYEKVHYYVFSAVFAKYPALHGKQTTKETFYLTLSQHGLGVDVGVTSDEEIHAVKHKYRVSCINCLSTSFDISIATAF